MKYTNIFKKQSFIIVISIITISVIIIGASYALFVSNHQGEDQTLSAGTLSATFTEDTIISANLVPLSDADALAASDNVYTFSLSNTGSLAMEYKLTLSNYLDGVNDSNMLAHKYIKIKFDNENPVYLDSLTKVDSSKTNENEIVYVIKTGVINSGVSNESHIIRIWISDTDSSGAETEESIIGKAIAFKIGLEGKATDPYNPPTLANYIKNLYSTQGENGLYFHDSSLENGANDGSYRYAGSNPNNYVCFGSDVIPCPMDNLYRIIGVFGDQVKLIKADYPTVEMLGSNHSYQQNVVLSDTYRGNIETIGAYIGPVPDESDNFTNKNLNENFINYLGIEWANKISNHVWQSDYNLKIEGNPTWKIGLINVKDFKYAYNSDYWNYSTYTSDIAVNNNWMYMGLYEFTFDYETSIEGVPFGYYITANGYWGIYYLEAEAHAARPTFYLNSDVTYESGTGSEVNPIIIG